MGDPSTKKKKKKKKKIFFSNSFTCRISILQGFKKIIKKNVYFIRKKMSIKIKVKKCVD
jgi:hypothetical protein